MRKSRAAWMHEKKFGMMVHWVAPGPPPQRGKRIKDLNTAVNRFDVGRFLEDFRRSGADWLVFTVGQNKGCYAGPNSVLDRLAGPGHCSERDLVLEIARGVKKRGSRFVAYLPCEVNGQSEAIKRAFGRTPAEEDADQKEFQKRYTDFVAEYSLRMGNRLDGWWFDGCYGNHPMRRNLPVYSRLWLGAARAGNPNAAVAFNDGSFCCGFSAPVVRGQDYLSGEVEFLIGGKVRFGRKKRLITPAQHKPQPPRSCLWHALVPIDCMWEHGIGFADWQNPPFKMATPERGRMERPLYAVDELETLVRDFKAVGGGVTFNVGIFQEGHLGPDTVAQLSELASRVA